MNQPLTFLQEKTVIHALKALQASIGDHGAAHVFTYKGDEKPAIVNKAYIQNILDILEGDGLSLDETISQYVLSQQDDLDDAIKVLNALTKAADLTAKQIQKHMANDKLI